MLWNSHQYVGIFESHTFTLGHLILNLRALKVLFTILNLKKLCLRLNLRAFLIVLYAIYIINVQ